MKDQVMQGTITDDRWIADLDENGYVHITGLPPDADHEQLIAPVGPRFPHFDGRTTWDIEADSAFDDTEHSLNTKELAPHTEYYELDGVPPKYLALWCINPAEDGGGVTTLCDTSQLVADLDDAEREVLASTPVAFSSCGGVVQMGLGSSSQHPVVQIRPGRAPIFRFSPRCLRESPKPVIRDFSDRAVSYFADNHVGIRLSRGDLLIWDNHRFLHGRTAYRDDRRRLRRALIGEAVVRHGSAR
jgi:alpha-ketoglutarate-dependent taurine dioxygenase